MASTMGDQKGVLATIFCASKDCINTQCKMGGGGEREDNAGHLNRKDD